jgi:CubicO group peptidase (beta-lactamase class C family)
MVSDEWATGLLPMHETRFGIASNTKLFTAPALALLVEEGNIEWDKPVLD